MNCPGATDYGALYELLIQHCDKNPGRVALDEDCSIILSMFIQEYTEWLSHIIHGESISFNHILNAMLGQDLYHSEDIRRIAEILWLAVNKKMFYIDNPLRYQIQRQDEEERRWGRY